ncbi:2'-5' RNA ligase family protein [Cellulomonas sp. NPDC089187]|uniref:2'-5' RNA ligase family protein n=1 Tax=Cellulomonas sp. NPDC089187 TaxID=3154970 RepID=UPI00343BCE69
MRRFFDRADTQWRMPQDCLHIYALPAPDDPARDDYRRMAAALAQIPGMGDQPVDYMHATVQRYDAFAAELADPRWQDALARMERVAAGYAPLDLVFGSPQVRSHAVEAVGELSAQWTALTAELRTAVSDAGLGSTVTEAPYAPHYTVAYCLAPTPDEVVARALAPVATATSFRVDRLSLVAVTPDQATGSFGFHCLREWKLAG